MMRGPMARTIRYKSVAVSADAFTLNGTDIRFMFAKLSGYYICITRYMFAFVGFYDCPILLILRFRKISLLVLTANGSYFQPRTRAFELLERTTRQSTCRGELRSIGIHG
jgi:hypothetical protein